MLFLGLYLCEFAQLRPGDQRMLTMTEVDGCSYRVIAQAFEMPPANVKVAIFRSRQRIHRGMAEALAALERMELEPTAAPASIPARIRPLRAPLRVPRRAAAPA